jgi:CheY-like chemotaxis protein
VRAEVIDNGEGMTEEIRRHLFDPFYTTKGQGGTGLGMSVAYGIITRHGGTIEVSSTIGRGTAFTLEFPRCEATEAAHIDAAEAEEQPVRRSRILVIDDEQAIAQLLEDALTAEGHVVTVAGSGTEGVELAELSRYDLVLTDLGMPDMSGWEVARRIRSRFPETPVVLVTGWGMTVSQEEVDRAGIAAVVHKPFEITDMLATTREVLAQSCAPRLPEPALADSATTRHRA